MSKGASFLLRAVIVIGLFYWILSQIEWPQLVSLFKEVHWGYLFTSFIFLIFNRFLMALKWFVLLKGAGSGWPFLKLFRITLISNFLGFFLPTSAGVDAIRFLELKKEQKSFSTALSSIVGDRILAIGALGGWSLLGVFLSWGVISEKKPLLESMCLIVLLFLVMALFFHRTSLRLAYLGVRILWSIPFFSRLVSEEKVKKKLSETHEAIGLIIRNKRLLIQLVFLNILFQGIRILQMHFLFRTFYTPVSPLHEMAFVPLIIFLTLVPVSVFGLGIKEGAFVYFFRQVGVDPAISLSVSLMSQVLQLLVILPGGLFLLPSLKQNRLPKKECNSEG